MNTTSIIRGALTAALAIGSLSPAFADDDDLPKMRAIATAAKLITLEEAQSRAIAARPGTVVDVDLERRFLGKQYDYEFEVIDTEGEEWEVNIDARDGSVSSMRRDWFD